MWRRFGQAVGGKRSAKVRPGCVFAEVEQELRNEVRLAQNRWRRHTEFSYLKPMVDAAKSRAKIAEQGSDQAATARAWLRALVLQAPQAAMAQVQMDRHKHSFRNREARVFELIDFNDAYVSTVLAMPADHYHTFNDELKRLIDWFCKRVGAWPFSNEQFEAIAHGLSREIAVYNAARSVGFAATMTTRTEDAFGIDMFITDPQTLKRVAIDTKTTSAFHYRLIELFREGRLSQDDIDLAERRGYVAVFNGHGQEKRRIVLWRIDHGTLGNIVDFAFERTDSLIKELYEIIGDYGE